MKRVVLLFLILLLVASAGYLKEISLLDYAQIVAGANKVNILIDKDLKNKKISFYFPGSIKPYTHLKAFKAVLYEYNLYLADLGSFYMVKRIKKSVYRKNYHFYKLKYLNFPDVQKLLKIYNSRYTYLKNTNTLVFFSTDEDFRKVSQFLAKIDRPKKQTSVRLTIFFSNISKIKELGSNISNFEFDLSNYLSYIYPGHSNNVLSGQNVFRFKTLIKYLVDHGYSQVIQKPSVLLRDNERVTFKVVKNIPFLVSKQIVQNNQTRNIETYEYKDVGLTISVFPSIFDDYVVLKLDLLLENVLNLSERPITSKISLNNSFKLNKGDLLVLSGFVQNDTKKSTSGVPVLKDLPILKHLFSFSKNSNLDYVLSIFIEII